MSKRGQVVNRPLRKSEFTIHFASKSAGEGWQAMLATRRNDVVTAWEWLTSTPLERALGNYPLKDELRWISRGGKRHERWQYKLGSNARIWFYVDGQIVHLEDVHTNHPNETK
ncbi:hypothetical protein [Ornithinimicrobium cavernae]|uniref:hypothetical protein n=1 Tax=Ornithinimicrobium cavernae TaxID=2666047 RepID=UPI000D696D53|nr:hypothetical protein [Ornithinimicrobium cavernae]